MVLPFVDLRPQVPYLGEVVVVIIIRSVKVAGGDPGTLVTVRTP